jgi:multiple sugar transport system permease protein/raffinose/stachyose/melibiose transport system permease protein
VRRKDLPTHLVLACLVALTFAPFVLMWMTSLKSNDQFFHQFWSFPWPMHGENYRAAWEAIRPYMWNSVMVSAASVTGIVGVASLSAYAFARHRFPGGEGIYYAIISLLMVPGVLTLISSFMWMKQFPFAGGNDWLGRGGHGLLNSHAGLILPYIAGGQVFAIVVLRSFIAALPEEMFEAARLDGAGELRVFASLVIPLCRPILGTVAIMNLIAVWNDYVWPLIVLSDDSKRTLAIGLAFFQGQHGTSYGPLMAGYVLACVPLLLLFLVTMRFFVEGLTAGALKS